MDNVKNAAKTSALIGAAFTFMTGWFGGGWATGQLAGKYGARFGWAGLFVPMIGVLLIIFATTWIIMEFARLYNVWDYANFMSCFYGHPIFKAIFDVIQILGLPLTFAGCVATFASTLVDYVGGSYIMWVIIFAVLVMLSVMWGTAILNKISTVMGVGILVLLVAIFAFIIKSGYGANVTEMIANRTMYDSYGSTLYNGGISLYMLSAGMALSVLPCFEPVQTRKDVTKTCLFNLLFVSAFIMIVTFNVLAFMPESVQEAIPMMYIMRTMGVTSWMMPIYVVVVLLAVLSTANAMCTGYGRRFMNFQFVKKMKANDQKKMIIISLLIIAISSVVSMLGITNIFYTGFTIMSYMNTPLVALGVPVVGICKLVQIRRRKLSLARGAFENKSSWFMFDKQAQ